ncbi:hypothetical protein CAL29_26865 [Bordetella genomosp. 10]|uniref:DUF3142 domain-containing protein n=1 Tax=Bordetella genomosp. 10 TaxID=1416804 RepID=A0A261S2E1_9BORD|nr:DUF3142 domain-containing protein [Bordetella genomosp. 10]OZI31518.1 hypothetical protein CAL29_26865 [Bordetella genomosp. 10]
MPRLYQLCALLLLVPLLAACQGDATPLPNDAYVWQRAWTPPLARALRANDDIVATWHVLGAEMDAAGRWADTAPDYAALAALRDPVVLVLRLDGRADRLDADAIEARLRERLTAWRAAGVRVGGVEIDYDCATARLPAYAALLRRLRAALDLPLSITALPTWLQSPDLDALLAVPDSSVLQVHAVLDPALGLFNPRRAAAWAGDYARRTRRPWRLALPSYGTRVAWDDAGRIVAVESERPALAPTPRDAELVAQPAVLADFSARLRQRPPAGLAGLVWFRLPTDQDQRAWSLATWRAVLTGEPLQTGLAPALAGTGATRDLLLVNRGNSDAPLPGIVRIAGDCAAADGINGYALERDGQGFYLRSIHDGLLRAHFQRNIGWLRCNDANPRLTLQP